MTQLETLSDPRPTTSDPEKPETRHGLAYRWERFGRIQKELPPLFAKHWREIALNQDKIQLDPSWDQYLAYDIANVLQVLTVRDEGKLVGYVFMLVHPHLHYASSVWAQSDIYWLDPAYRFGWSGIRMFREVEKGMKRLGVEVVLMNMKLHFQEDRGTIEKLFARLKYKPIEVLWAKYIG